MQRAISFQMLSGGSLSYTTDVDLIFVGARSTASVAGSQVITTDPALTAAVATTPTSTRIITDLIWANQNTGQAANIPTKIPIPKGTTLFVSCATVATTVIAYFDEVDS
jgi:hypothetical protein